MADPNNIKTFDTPFPMNTVTAFAVLKKSLYFGDKFGNFHIFSKLTRKLKLRGTFTTAKPNYMIKTIIPFPTNNVLVHWTGLNGQTGPVQVFYTGGVRTQIKDTAKIVCSDTSSSSPYVALINDANVVFYKFYGPVLAKTNLSFDAAGPIRCASINSKGLLYYAKDSYHLYNPETKKDTVVSKKTAKNPSILILSDDSFLLTSDDYQFIYSPGKEDKIVPYDLSNGQPLFCIGTESNIYQFYQKSFTRGPLILTEGHSPQIFNEPGTVFASMCFRELVLCTANSLRVVAAMASPDVLARRYYSENKEQEVIDTVLHLQGNEQFETFAAIFDELWIQNAQKALTFAQQFKWMEGVSEFLKLFSILMLPIDNQNKEYNSLPNASKQPPKDDSTLYPLLQKCLENFRNAYFDSTASYAHAELRVLNTALAELYSISHSIRQLDELLTEGNVDIETVINFVTTNLKTLKLTPARALIYIYQGDVPKSVKTWMLMENSLNENKRHNPMFVTECAFAVKKLARDQSELLHQSFEWLFDKDINAAVEASLSTAHDPLVVLKWYDEKKLVAEKLHYYHFLVTAPNYSPSHEIINNTFFQYINTFKAISSYSEEQLKPYAFFLQNVPAEFRQTSNIAQNTPGKEEETIKLELNKENLSKVIMFYSKLLLDSHGININAQQAVDILTPDLDPEIQLLLFRVSEQYEKGLDTIFNGSTDFTGEIVEKVETFCKKAPSPSNAFNALFAKVPIPTLLASNIGFIERNLQYMDLIAILKAIPPDEKIKKVHNIFKRAVGILMEKRDSLKLQKAVAKSMRVDIDYNLSQAKCRYCKLDSTPTCAKCGKLMDNVQMRMAPNGALYHTTCYTQEQSFE